MSDHKDPHASEHAANPHASHGGGGGGHQEEHEEHEGAPEWLISFADNTALMMGFFVILLAMNMAPKGSSPSAPSDDSPAKPTSAQLDWALGVRAAFNNPVKIDSTNPGEQLMVRRLRQKLAEKEAIEKGPKGASLQVQSIRPTDYHALSGAVQFEDNSTELTPDARQHLEDVARHIRGLRLVVEVRGFSSAAEAFHQNDKGLRLSFDRAVVVAEALGQMGLDWRQLRVIASGDNDRLHAVAYDAQEHKKNQRVEIIVTDAPLEKPNSPASDSAPQSNRQPPDHSDHTRQPAHDATNPDARNDSHSQH